MTKVNATLDSDATIAAPSDERDGNSGHLRNLSLTYGSVMPAFYSAQDLL